MVAKFKYSTVAIYNVSVPPQKLEFSNSIRQEWLRKETENVCLFYADFLVCDNALSLLACWKISLFSTPPVVNLFYRLILLSSRCT